jgi:hypothetical protein
LAWVFGFLSPCPAAGTLPTQAQQAAPKGPAPAPPSPLFEGGEEGLKGSPGKVADAGRKEGS